MENILKRTLIFTPFCAICAFFLLSTLIITPEISRAEVGTSQSKFTPNTKESSLVWSGYKLTGSHTGHLGMKNAEPVIKDGKLVGGTFSIDMSTIVNEDVKDEAYNTKLTSHLKSEDFFNIAKFPLSELKLTKAEPIANAKPGEPNYTLTGDLTIIGNTNQITFPALVKISNNSAFASASIKIDRTQWNLRYGSGKFFQGLGDKLIYDEFLVEVKIVGTLE